MHCIGLCIKVKGNVYLTENTGHLLPRHYLFFNFFFYSVESKRLAHLFLLSVLRVIISFLSPVVKYMRTNAYVNVVKTVKDFKKKHCQKYL